MDPNRLQPALYGGLFIGVLSALPIVSMGNCCCCLWVIAGGALAAYLRQQNSAFQVQASEGALVGLLAGFIGGIVAAILSIPMQLLMSGFQQQIMDRMLSNPDMTPEVRNIIERFGAGSAFRAVSAVGSVVVSTVFGMLGGLLGVAMFKKKNAPPPPPPGTIDVMPPPPPSDQLT